MPEHSDQLEAKVSSNTGAVPRATGTSEGAVCLATVTCVCGACLPLSLACSASNVDIPPPPSGPKTKSVNEIFIMKNGPICALVGQ